MGLKTFATRNKGKLCVLTIILLLLSCSGLAYAYSTGKSDNADKKNQIKGLEQDAKKANGELSRLNTKLNLVSQDKQALQAQIKEMQDAEKQRAQPKLPNLILSVTGTKTVDYNPATNLPANKRHVFIDIGIQNTGDAMGAFTADDRDKHVKFVGSDGMSYFNILFSIVPQNEGHSLIPPQNVLPGETVKGSIYLILDKSITSGTLYFNDQSVAVNLN